MKDETIRNKDLLKMSSVSRRTENAETSILKMKMTIIENVNRLIRANGM